MIRRNRAPGEPLGTNGAAATVALLAAAARKAHDYATKRWAGVRPGADRYALMVHIPTALDVGHDHPAVDGVLTRSVERSLVAAGWRFLPVPRYRRRAHLAGPAIAWSGGIHSCLAVPPEKIDVAARLFGTKRDALAWAIAVDSRGGADDGP